jgi:D-alanyl-lipoteichoic acid acyltransferase DltB (MBOAT superfamily)
MNFTSLSFWGFLIVGILLIMLLRGVIRRLRFKTRLFDKVSLLTLNLSLLFLVSRLTLIIFLMVMVVSYLTLLWLKRSNIVGVRKRILLSVLIFIQFLPLVFYKYGWFIMADIFHEPEMVGFLKGMLIPVGLSFYTFQKVGFVLDYAKDHTRFPAFLDYCLYSSFFPQIVAGPIERRDDLLPQMEKFVWHFSWLRFWQGLRWVIIGLFFKLSLAENIAAFSKWSYAPSDSLSDLAGLHLIRPADLL